MRSRLETKRQWSGQSGLWPDVQFVPVLCSQEKGFDVLLKPCKKVIVLFRANMTLTLFSPTEERPSALFPSSNLFPKNSGFELMEDKNSVLLHFSECPHLVPTARR